MDSRNYHNRASDESRWMCEKLEAILASKIQHLIRSESQQWCGLSQQGKSVFAYVNHRRRMKRIEIWIMGDPEKLQRHTTLTVQKRLPTTGGFGARFQSRVFIDSRDHLDEIANMLCVVSFPLS